MDNFIYAIKGRQVTRFTQFIWKNMGTRKNDWEVITKEQYDSYTLDGILPETSQPTLEPTGTVKDDTEYKKLTDQAKGFLTDGKLGLALKRFKAASEIKTNSWLKGQINQLNALIEAQNALDEVTALLVDADNCLEIGEYEEAIELYQSVLELSPGNEKATTGMAKATEELEA